MKKYSASCHSMTCNLIFLAAHHHPDRKTSIVNVNVVKWFGFPRFLAMKFFLIIGSDRKACGSILREERLGSSETRNLIGNSFGTMVVLDFRLLW